MENSDYRRQRLVNRFRCPNCGKNGHCISTLYIENNVIKECNFCRNNVTGKRNIMRMIDYIDYSAKEMERIWESLDTKMGSTNTL